MALLNFFVNYYTVTASLVTTVLLVLLYKTKYSYWKSQGVPGPTPLPLIGLSIDILFESIPTLSLKHSKKYGRVHGTYEGLNPKLVVSDPEVVKQICIKDFHIFTNRRKIDKDFHKLFGNMLVLAMDDKWRRLRKIISPTFSTGKIKRMKPLMDKCIENAMDQIELIASKKEPLNLWQFWSKYILEVIGRCIFSVNINVHKEPNNEFFMHFKRMFLKPGIKQVLVIMLVYILPFRIFKLLNIELVPASSFDFMSAAIIDLLKKRRQTGSNHNDFLELLVEAENENNNSESPLTEDEIIANCFLFFTSGYETTTTLLQFCCYALAMNPEIQEKVYDEIKSTFPDGKSIDYDVAIKLPYLDALVSETFRMYPPSNFIERTSSASVQIEGTGITIPANTVINIPSYAIHHDPEYYPKPEIFKPERFLGENKENVNPYSYVPFGIGPRSCIAMRFALTAAKLALIHTIMNFKIEKCNKTPSVPKYITGTQALATKNILVQIHKRENNQ